MVSTVFIFCKCLKPGVATFGIWSVIYGIIFTIIQTQVIYLLNKSHKVDAKILKATH